MQGLRHHRHVLAQTIARNPAHLPFNITLNPPAHKTNHSTATLRLWLDGRLVTTIGFIPISEWDLEADRQLLREFFAFKPQAISVEGVPASQKSLTQQFDWRAPLSHNYTLAATHEAITSLHRHPTKTVPSVVFGDGTTRYDDLFQHNVVLPCLSVDWIEPGAIDARPVHQVKRTYVRFTILTQRAPLARVRSDYTYKPLTADTLRRLMPHIEQAITNYVRLAIDSTDQHAIRINTHRNEAALTGFLRYCNQLDKRTDLLKAQMAELGYILAPLDAEALVPYGTKGSPNTRYDPFSAWTKASMWRTLVPLGSTRVAAGDHVYRTINEQLGLYVTPHTKTGTPDRPIHITAYRLDEDIYINVEDVPADADPHQFALILHDHVTGQFREVPLRWFLLDKGRYPERTTPPEYRLITTRSFTPEDLNDLRAQLKPGSSTGTDMSNHSFMELAASSPASSRLLFAHDLKRVLNSLDWTSAAATHAVDITLENEGVRNHTVSWRPA